MVWSRPTTNLPHTSVIYFSTKIQGKLGKGSFSEAAEQLGAEGSPGDLCRVSQDLLWLVISSWAPRGAGAPQFIFSQGEMATLGVRSTEETSSFTLQLS